jgi:prevent-host-death family protein
MEWKLADAKNRFSEVFRLVLSDGPQWVRRRGDTVVILSEAEFERLSGAKRDFKDFLFKGPNLDELDLERDRTPMRDLDL